ncbi:MAG: flagellar biosynthesis anti-sigma factor FlgM [Lachnospiraceae bacterium]|nr:flagellar biosynthesis anti-sigma factor FlgM [Lachnospiraceae bacterium]
MRIEAYTQVQQLYNTKNTNKAKQTSGTSFKDQLQISSVGKDIQAAKQAVNSAPDVREEITAPIKASIQNGTYEVSGESFADKMIEKYNQQGLSF